VDYFKGVKGGLADIHGGLLSCVPHPLFRGQLPSWRFALDQEPSPVVRYQQIRYACACSGEACDACPHFAKSCDYLDLRIV
jgi:hypothetical protein